MPRFSSHSLAVLKTVDPSLREICMRAIKEYDFSVLCGHRNEHDQNEAYDAGRSRLKWPNSKHNSYPSLAVDIAPYPILWSDPVRFVELSKIIKRIASEIMIPIQWGGSWVKFCDMPHYELTDWSLVDGKREGKAL
jgi:peptidoglycan L-alanyl-D-glutamate endopeptidase CwlK